MGRYLDLAQRAMEQPIRRASEPTGAAQLRSHLAALRARIDRGFEVLRAREEAGKTGRPYPLWLETWEKLVREYEDTADKLAALTGCPIGDCSRFETCATRPAPCPAVGGEPRS